MSGSIYLKQLTAVGRTETTYQNAQLVAVRWDALPRTLCISQAVLAPSEHLCAHWIPHLTITTATEVMARQGIWWGFEPTRDQP